MRERERERERLTLPLWVCVRLSIVFGSNVSTYSETLFIFFTNSAVVVTSLVRSHVVFTFTLHLVIWQTLWSKATYNWGIHKAIHLEEAIRLVMLVTRSLSHCSKKYKLAREGEKDRGKDFFFLSLGWSQVVPKEMSFQLLLEDWQGSSIPDRGFKLLNYITDKIE